MNDSRFIELLNLYVDQQLTPAEAAELETEITRNAERRRTYQQYCRIQRGCALLFEQERTQAPRHQKLADALAKADQKVIDFPNQRVSRMRNYMSLGLVAAAACIAVVVMNRNGVPDQASGVAVVTPAASAPAESAQPVAIPAQAVAPNTTAARPEFYSVLAARRLPGVRDQGKIYLGTDDSPEAFASYNWMREVELTPVATLSTERITLQQHHANGTEDRMLRSRKPMNGASTEMTAFQFQR